MLLEKLFIGRMNCEFCFLRPLCPVHSRFFCSLIVAWLSFYDPRLLHSIFFFLSLVRRIRGFHSFSNSCQWQCSAFNGALPISFPLHCRRTMGMPEAGYSKDTIEARETILRGALETLNSTALRRDYDERLRLNEVYEDVPDEYVPSTLALLQECGDLQTVIAAGDVWLSKHGRRKDAKDVGLAVSLARCELARSILDNDGSIDEAVDMLLKASGVLSSNGGEGLPLYQKIKVAISDLRPALVIELLHSVDARTRYRGLTMVPEVLRSYQEIATSDHGGANGLGSREAAARGDLSRPQFLTRLRDLLTAEEHVQIYESAPDAYAQSPSELYAAAMAHISAGVTVRSVTMIERAEKILRDAEDLANQIKNTDNLNLRNNIVRNAKSVEERQRRAVASCVVALLLGDSSAAGEALGLHDGRIRCDRQVLAFIRAHSEPGTSSLLPGVCTLTERWINEVALASYKSTSNASSALDRETFDLNSWFEDPRVVKKLEERLYGKRSGIIGTVGSLAKAFVGLFVRPATTQKAENRSETASIVDSRDALQKTGRPTGVEHQASKQGTPTVLHPNTGSETTTETERSKDVESEILEGIPSNVLRPSGKDAEGKVRDDLMRSPQNGAQDSVVRDKPTLEVAEASYETAYPHEKTIDFGTTTYDDSDPVFLETPVALESIHPLRGEDDWMRSAYEARRILWGRVLVAAAVAAAGLVTLGRAVLPAGVTRPWEGWNDLVTKRTDAEVSDMSMAKPGSPLSASEASSLVKQWQRIKSEALGPQHRMERLEEVLAGNLLQQWKVRASELALKGWYYKHDLKSKTVNAVRQGKKPGTATVIATLKEGVTVYKPDEPQPQTFVSEYSVEYQAMHRPGGRWVLTAATVNADL